MPTHYRWRTFTSVNWLHRFYYACEGVAYPFRKFSHTHTHQTCRMPAAAQASYVHRIGSLDETDANAQAITSTHTQYRVKRIMFLADTMECAMNAKFSFHVCVCLGSLRKCNNSSNKTCPTLDVIRKTHSSHTHNIFYVKSAILQAVASAIIQNARTHTETTQKLCNTIIVLTPNKNQTTHTRRPTEKANLPIDRNRRRVSMPLSGTSTNRMLLLFLLMMCIMVHI